MLGMHTDLAVLRGPHTTCLLSARSDRLPAATDLVICRARADRQSRLAATEGRLLMRAGTERRVICWRQVQRLQTGANGHQKLQQAVRWLHIGNTRMVLKVGVGVVLGLE